MKKKIIFISISLIIVIGIVVLIMLPKENNLISKEKTVEGVKFSKAKIEEVNGKYTFYVTVTTSSKNILKVDDFDATIYDKKGNRIETLSGYIGDLDNNTKKEVTIDSNEDLSNAYEINYSLRINND